ncbi:G-protein coupled receptor family C group 6 member A-like [Lampris incognitus]|uniref:G-protein coupled receptor family C group 6 member A-like n=1 Tax=Lampris incognitus TaxID=2546036 RepID=UPI0024B5E90A|nr:G-protein coupled receptor family C group 6 member A-like [Lampris incognitus]
MHAPGDIIIGGLFQIHSEANKSAIPVPLVCSGHDFETHLQAQVMIFAIQEINQRKPKVLPNFTLGYDIYDTCGDVRFAIRSTLQLLRGPTDPQSCSSLGDYPSVLPEPHAKVVIGERHSEVSIAVARILALASVPQISYGSTSELLSRKLKFPTFLRTIPSDAHQVEAIAKLVKRFNWQIVAVIGSDDEYGKYGSEHLIDLFSGNQCIDFKMILPGYFMSNKTKTRDKLAELMNLINQSSAEAIILFTKESNVKIIMEAAVQMNINRTLIASDSWSTSHKISEMPGIERVGQVFGFISKKNEVPGFEDYVKSMINSTTNTFLKDNLMHCSPCSSPSTSRNGSMPSQRRSCLDPRCLVSYIDQDESYNIYLAVRVIAEGLRRLLKCDSEKCERSADFTALELFREIKNVDFTVNNVTHMSFDDNGDPTIGYDIVKWDMAASNLRIKTIGEYRPSGEIILQEHLDHLIRESCNVTVTAYNCSKTCQPGFELKKKRGEPCCKECIRCRKGHYSTGKGMECEQCKEDQYTPLQRHRCLEKPVVFLTWSDPFIIAILLFEMLGIVATLLVAILFMVYRRTPIVKAVGGHWCFVELLSLLACFCLICTFTGKPTKLSCAAGLPVFGMTFTLCVCCILANLLQILAGFSFNKRLGNWLKRLNQPLAVVAILSGVQVALCAVWLICRPPFPFSQPINKEIILGCNKNSRVFFIAMLGYIALLALTCFLFAFKGKRLPDLYKNASFVTISMLLFLVVWLIFIPIYISNKAEKYTRALEAAAILVSSYSILCCHLAPKCYIMVFRKEINDENAITNYIKKHFEQKGMTVAKT